MFSKETAIRASRSADYKPVNFLVGSTTAPDKYINVHFHCSTLD